MKYLVEIYNNGSYIGAYQAFGDTPEQASPKIVTCPIGMEFKVYAKAELVRKYSQGKWESFTEENNG